MKRAIALKARNGVRQLSKNNSKESVSVSIDTSL
jgi:hypothetical protein